MTKLKAFCRAECRGHCERNMVQVKQMKIAV